MGLPLPKNMATRKSRVDKADLPVGGAPPVDAPNLADIAARSRALPQHIEDQQLPQSPRRSSEEIREDFKKAVAVLQNEKTETAAEKPGIEVIEDEFEAKEGEGPTFGDMRSGTFAWDEYHAALQEISDFRRPEIRKAIESRCKDIDVEDLILYESVTQRQIIVPGKLEPVFRSLTASEDLAIKQWVYEIKGSDRYVLDSITLMTLTMGLKSFNDAELPDHMKKNELGERAPDKELFEKKMRIVQNIGTPIIGIMTIAYKWFDERVRRTLVTGVLGK
jgi:hypothetical protein